VTLKKLNFKKTILSQTVIILSVLMATSCQMTPCNIQDRPAVSTKEGELLEAKVDKLKKGAVMKSVKVFKPDGSLQCNQGQSISIKEMQADLKDIKVISSEKKHDGLMRIQVCGQPTGMSNVFEIPDLDLDKAKERGFKIWKKD
jgi:hypothetical protein